jgi:hypothetical protein
MEAHLRRSDVVGAYRDTYFAFSRKLNRIAGKVQQNLPKPRGVTNNAFWDVLADVRSKL